MDQGAIEGLWYVEDRSICGLLCATVAIQWVTVFVVVDISEWVEWVREVYHRTKSQEGDGFQQRW